MASFQETTAISLRKGSTSECDAFTGILGECVFCSGDDSAGTDINTTLRIHNGITQGGISMARADLTNVNTKALATHRNWLGDKNLAYADLSNIETLSDSTAIALVFETLHGYGLASIEQIDDLEDRKANRTMDNVETSTLADGRTPDTEGKNGNLAYTNMSNVNTKYLADSQYRTGEDDDKALAYADASNVNTANLIELVADRPSTMQGPVLTDKDLSNVTDEVFKSHADDINTEYTTFKDQIINPESSGLNTHYPTIGAVIDYTAQEIGKLEYMDPEFLKAESWEALYTNAAARDVFNTDPNMLTATGTNYTVDMRYSDNPERLETINTITPVSYWNATALPVIPLKLAVYNTQVGDDNNKEQPKRYRLYPEYGKTDLGTQTLTFVTEEGGTCTGTLTTTQHPSNSSIYRYQFEKTGADGDGWAGIPAGLDDFVENAPKYDCSTTIMVEQVLCMELVTVEAGAITGFNFVPSYVAEALQDTTSTVYHPILADGSLQSGNNASVDITVSNDLPLIGGAGLVKMDLSNLPGMTNIDIAANAGAQWTINKSKTVDRAAVTIPASEYNRLLTAGQMYDTIKNTTAVTIRKWS